MDEVEEDARFTGMAQKRPLAQSAYWGQEEPSGESLEDSDEQPDVVNYLQQWKMDAKDAHDLCTKAAGYFRSMINFKNPELRGKRIK